LVEDDFPRRFLIPLIKWAPPNFIFDKSVRQGKMQSNMSKDVATEELGRYPLSVLFQVPNTIGLGHIRRTSAIALALRGLAPASRTAFIIDGKDHGLLASMGLPSIELPRYSSAKEGWHSNHWEMVTCERLLTRFAEEVLEHFRPSVVVFDTVPNFTFFAAVRRLQVAYCVIARKAKWPAFYSEQLKDVAEHARRIIVPHSREEFELQTWQSKTDYVGRILQPGPVVATHEFDHVAQPIIVITGGGGGYPGTVDFYNLAAEACLQVERNLGTMSALLVLGPLFSEPTRLKPGNTVLVSSCWNMPGLFDRASLIVCQAGYNTVEEVLRAGKPAIVVPAKRDIDDQAERAHFVASSHPQVRVLERPTAQELAATISGVLALGPRVVASQDRSHSSPSGAMLAAEILVSLNREA
jgi:predicted glycosyltransferase